MTLRLAVALALPCAGALLATPLRSRELRNTVRIGLALAALGATAFALPDLDRLSGVFAIVVSAVSLLATVFSTSIFPSRERLDSGWSNRPTYFVLLGAFWSSMLFAVASTTFTGIWIGISATTLATTFLVGFSGGKSALEAAWKYLILCSFGIAIALLGMLLLGRAGMAAGIAPGAALSWQALAAHAALLPPELARAALLLMVVGFATKAGLVPMHSWLPDAHSKAPASISALLSGLLVSCSLYAIVRVQGVADAVIPRLFDGTLLALGGASVTIAALLMLTQRDLKRFLSYSTIEHSGLVAIALSIGTPLGSFAAIFHALNHAVTKAAAFLASGAVQYERGTTNIGALRGLFASGSGKMLLAAIAGLAGFPPFGIFFSEFLIVIAAVEARDWTALAIAGVGTVIAFAALARLAIETQSSTPPPRPVVPRLALGTAATLLVAAVAGALVPFVRLP